MKTAATKTRFCWIVDLLRVYWKRYPDLRLGQIVGNFTPSNTIKHDLGGGKAWVEIVPGNIYQTKDSVVENELRKHTQK